MINVVIKMIVILVVLGGIANGTGHRCPIRILTIVHLVLVIALAVHVVIEAAPDLRTDLDPAPLWSALVMTVMNRRAGHPIPVVPVFLKGADMMGQGL